MTVRTSRFKNWFGDWEGLQRKDSVSRPQVEVAASDQNRHDLYASARQRFQGQSFFNASLGRDIGVTGKGLKHIKATSFDLRKVQALSKTGEILEKGIYIGAEPVRTPNNNVKQYHRLATHIRLNGESLIVESVIRETNIGDLLYDFGLTEIVKPAGISDEVSETKSSLRPTAGSTPSKLLQNVFSVNENDVSKVVDENGEPLVVYHGTNADFEAFDIEKAGSNRDAGLLGTGLYFSSDPDKSCQTL